MNRRENDRLLEEVYSNVHEVFIEDKTVMSLLRLYEKRSNEGMKKYGQSMSENDGDLKYWLQHALEEAMDLSLYLKRALDELEGSDNELQ